MSNDTDQIVADANAALGTLEALEDELLADIKEVKKAAALGGRQLTKNEKLECDLLDSRLTDVYEAIRVVSIQSLRRIDNSQGIKLLQKELRMVNSDLSDDLKRLKKVQRYAKVAADVSQALAKVATRISALSV